MNDLTQEQLDKYLSDWGILLEEQMNIALDTNWGQKFLWDTAVSWECFVDEVNRIDDCITLYDEITTLDSRFLMFAITMQLKYLPLEYFTVDDLQNLKQMIDDELKEREDN